MRTATFPREKLFIDPLKVWLNWWWSQYDDGLEDNSKSEGPAWVMDKTLYGRRIASKWFNLFVKGILEGLGFELCPAQLQVYKHFLNTWMWRFIKMICTRRVETSNF